MKENTKISREIFHGDRGRRRWQEEKNCRMFV
jgi:hypothetical protein